MQRPNFRSSSLRLKLAFRHQLRSWADQPVMNPYSSYHFSRDPVDLGSGFLKRKGRKPPQFAPNIPAPGQLESGLVHARTDHREETDFVAGGAKLLGHLRSEEH